MPAGIYFRPNAAIIVTRTCRCGNEFSRKSWPTRLPTTHCSRKCTMETVKEKRLQKMQRLPYDWFLLYFLYVDRGLTTPEIGKLFDVDHSVVKFRMSELEIERRPMGSRKGSKHKNPRPRISKNIRRGFIEEREWRLAIYKRDNYTCQICGKHGGVLNADHIKPVCLFPELVTDLSNGRTLCVPCHKATPTYGAKVRSYAKAISSPSLQDTPHTPNSAVS